MVNAFLDDTSVIHPQVHSISRFESSLNNGVLLGYDDVTDELLIHFAPVPERRHVDPINRYLSYYCNSDTDEPFGFMLENFLTHAVHEHPKLESIAKYLQLGERPYRDSSLYRTDAPPRTSLTDYAWRDAAHDAIENIVEITGGIVEELETAACSI